MKKNYFLALLSFLPFLLSAQTEFITTWKTDNLGASGDNQITIPTFPGETYNYSVDWGDGTSDINVTGNITHTYDVAGIYKVSISGLFAGISLSNSGETDRQKILEVNQWGTVQWQNFQGAFGGAQNLEIKATDVPDLSQVTSFRYAFSGCTSLVGHSSMNLWDMSNAVNLNAMFYGASLFNTYIGDWNLANAEDITEMFRYASSFNQDIGNWRFPKVTSIQWMFNYATNFNGDIGNWDVSNIEAMSFAFEYAKTFNQDISNWDTSNVTTTGYMFNNAIAFNQDISGWDVSNVRSMAGMFANAISFDQDLGDWDIQSATSLGIMFNQTRLSTKNYDNTLAGWATLPSLQSNIVFDAGFSQYCDGESSRHVLIDNFGWEIMDEGLSCPEPLSIVEVLIIDAVEDDVLYTLQPNARINRNSLANNLFNFEVYTSDDVGSVHIELQDTQNVSNTSNEAPYTLFGNSGSDYHGEELELGTYTLIVTPYSGDNLTGSMGTPHVLNFKVLDGVARPFIATWKTDTPGSANTNIIRIETLPGEQYYYDVDWGDGRRSHGFSGSTNHAYQEPGTYTIEISGNFPGLVFGSNDYASKLISIDQWGDVDWVTMKDAFMGCVNMDIRATDSPDLSNVEDMSRMFMNCSSLTGNTSIENWKTEGVANMSQMFEGATVFDQDISSWDVSNVIDMQNMFKSSGWSNANYEATLLAWSQLPSLKSNVKFGAQQNTYCSTREAHEYLTNDLGWIIHDGGLELNCVIDGQRPFLTTWKTDNVGASSNNQITIYTDTRFPGYNYTVEWGDGTKDTNVQGDIVHTYADPGVYRVAIYDHFLGMYINNAGNVRFRDDEKILSIDQWGDIQWEVLHSSFSGCGNLDMKATDIPDLSKGPRLSGLFGYCPSLIGNESINDWDISAVSKTSYMFSHATSFNQSLDNWDTGIVTNMEYMFDGATSFDQDVSTWNVSNVNHMMDMFNESGFSDINYNKALIAWAELPSLKEDVRLGAPQNQFCDATLARYDLLKNHGWEITDMGSSSGCTIFNPEEYFITTWKTNNPGVSEDNQITIPTYPGETYNYTVDWGDGTSDTHVTGNMVHTYAEPGIYEVSIIGQFPRIYFNYYPEDDKDYEKLLTVEQWGSILWTSMRGAFSKCSNLDIVAWDVPNLFNVRDMDYMFLSCQNLIGNSKLSQWDVSNVTSMVKIFGDATAFNQDIGNWNVARVTNMNNMFHNANSFNQDISSWDTSNVTNMVGMFYKSEAFDQDISNWNVGNVTEMRAMFSRALSFNKPLGAWDVGNVTDMTQMFAAAASFNQDIGNWNVSKVTTMDAMFSGASSFNQDIGNWDVSSVVNTNVMFANSAFNQDIGNWNVGNVTDMGGMFYGATFFNQSLGNWNVSNVGYMGSIFKETSLSVENYDKTLLGWATLDSLQRDNMINAQNVQYCEGEEARQSLIDNYGWIITDDGKVPYCNEDNDNDGVLDHLDNCLNTQPGWEVDSNGCEIVPHDALRVYTLTPACPGGSDGVLEVFLDASGYIMDVLVEGDEYTNTFFDVGSGQPFRVTDLPVGFYSVSISISEIQYQQHFGVTINELGSVTGKRIQLDNKTGTAIYTVSGSTQYKVNVNGAEQMFNFEDDGEESIQLNGFNGFNEVTISGLNDCQGSLEDSFFIKDEIMLYPTIVSNEIYVLADADKLDLEIYTFSGRLIRTISNMESRALDVSTLDSGMYLVKIIADNREETIKIIKK